jgi:alanyl-tRNA synthetase
MDMQINEFAEDGEDITPEDSSCPIYLVELTQEELEDMENMHNEVIAIAVEQQNKENARQSAIAKLTALGLTEEEATALISI